MISVPVGRLVSLFMGVRTQTVTPRLVRLHHLSADSGAYVATVTPAPARREPDCAKAT